METAINQNRNADFKADLTAKNLQGKLNPKNIYSRSKQFLSEKPTLYSLFAVIGALGVGYWLVQKRGKADSQSNGGMKIGPDSGNKDMDPKFGEGTRDRVEEASWESFPASDPPAY